MTNCTQAAMEFPQCQRRMVEARFEGGSITSDGGVLLLCQADRYLGLSPAVVRIWPAPHRQASCTHNGAMLWRQRLVALVLGYEGLNNHQSLRAAWLKVRIIFRGYSGFCPWSMLAWCERHEVGYIVGFVKNKRLNRRAQPTLERAAAGYLQTGYKAWLYEEFYYDAVGIMDRPRRMTAKAEYTAKGTNSRYVVTNLPGKTQAVYDRVYYALGEVQNCIKEQQLDLFADDISDHHAWPNQFRLLLSSLAHILLETFRRVGLSETELTRNYVGTLCLKLLKIDAVTLRNTRRVRFQLPSDNPYQELFRQVAACLVPR